MTLPKGSEKYFFSSLNIAVPIAISIVSDFLFKLCFFIAVMEPKFKMVVVGGGATGRTAERESAGPPPQVSPDLVWSAILNLALVSYLIFRFSEF